MVGKQFFRIAIGLATAAYFWYIITGVIAHRQSIPVLNKPDIQEFRAVALDFMAALGVEQDGNFEVFVKQSVYFWAAIPVQHDGTVINWRERNRVLLDRGWEELASTRPDSKRRYCRKGYIAEVQGFVQQSNARIIVSWGSSFSECAVFGP